MADMASTAVRPQFEPLEHETIKRVAWRLMPVLMLGYFCAYLDRVNVGFAKLTMQHSLGFSEAVFGFGAGVFFIGYFLAEIPSNLILNQRRRAQVDRPHPAHLGHHLRSDRLRLERLELLYHPLPARLGRSGLLSGHRAVPDLVVPVLLPLAHDGDLPVGQRDLADRRAAGIGVAADDGRGARPARLAVAVPDRGTAAHHHVRRHLGAADRSSKGRGMAAARTADLAAATSRLRSSRSASRCIASNSARPCATCASGC